MTAPAMSIPAETTVSLERVRAELEVLGATLTGDGRTVVRGVRQDSRSVGAGELFCARAGGRADGAAFATAAVARGAVAVLAEHGVALPELGVPVLRVTDVRRALGAAAELVYGYPSRALALVGVTGTNGKTTTTLLLDHALRALGARPARLGTLGFAFGEEEDEGTLTTPEADDVSRALRSVVDRGGTHFVMEVSSHALSLARADALRFSVAAFTNLTQDHLDFYPSMREYGAAKARLFTELSPAHAVINGDDAFGAELSRGFPGAIVTGRSETATLRVLTSTVDARGVSALVRTPSGSDVTLASRLIGEHNLENLSTALGVLLALGFPPAASARALEGAPPAPGRLERCDAEGDDIAVLVDYAHTPDALERVLAALRRVSSGELVCVFGCGGDRDPTKRPRMGSAAARGADRVILTSDNPRTEDPQAIARQVLPGLAEGPARSTTELDRTRAIESAISSAPAGAVVLIAGKGHESYQIIGAEKLPFDDRVVARQALAARRARGGT
jgi:UDP-N-acetylmuramoyl-L-alanyl-D-glutamate--2,6-diaminopimelate ligase